MDLQWPARRLRIHQGIGHTTSFTVSVGGYLPASDHPLNWKNIDIKIKTLFVVNFYWLVLVLHCTGGTKCNVQTFKANILCFRKLILLFWTRHRQTVLCTSFKLYHLVIITRGLFQMFQQFEHHCFKSFLLSYFYGKQFVTPHYFDQWNWIAHTRCKKLIALADNANIGSLFLKYLQVINHSDLPLWLASDIDGPLIGQ